MRIPIRLSFEQSAFRPALSPSSTAKLPFSTVRCALPHAYCALSLTHHPLRSVSSIRVRRNWERYDSSM